MRTRRRSTTGALMLLITFMLTACDQFGAASPTPTAIPPTTSAPSPEPSPVAITTGPPDTLRWSLEGIANLPTIDPAKSGDAQVNTVITMIFGGLVRLDEQQEIQPDGAEDWHISADRKVYTFTIREGLTYADGTPVTSADFAFSINRALRPETASYGAPSRLSNIVGALDVVNGDAAEASGIKASDPRTLEITLDVPAAYFLAQLSYPYTFAVPQQLVESGPDWEERAYGTGPFKVVEWKHNDSILLAANERYWRGKPGFEKLLMPFSKDSETAYQRYHAGELDIMGSGQNPIPSARIAELQGRPDFKSAAVLTTRFIGFNTIRPPFDSVDVRQAFALAIDKGDLANRVLLGTAVPAGRILPAGMLGTQVAIKPLAFDVQAARQALTRAGYADGAALPPVALAYAREGDNQLVVEALQKMWQENLGVTVTLQPFPDAPAISMALDTTYFTPTEGLQFYLSVWGADYPDPQNFISQQFRTGVRNNNGHFSDPQVDRWVDEADQLSDRDQIELRLQLYGRAEQIAIDKVGWLPLFYPKFNILLNPRVEGLAITPNGLVAPDWAKVRLK